MTLYHYEYNERYSMPRDGHRDLTGEDVWVSEKYNRDLDGEAVETIRKDLVAIRLAEGVDFRFINADTSEPVEPGRELDSPVTYDDLMKAVQRIERKLNAVLDRL